MDVLWGRLSLLAIGQTPRQAVFGKFLLQQINNAFLPFFFDVLFYYASIGKLSLTYWNVNYSKDISHSCLKSLDSKCYAACIQIQSFLNQSISVRIRPEHKLLFLSPLRIHLFSTPIETLAIEHEIRGFVGVVFFPKEVNQKVFFSTACIIFIK